MQIQAFTTPWTEPALLLSAIEGVTFPAEPAITQLPFSLLKLLLLIGWFNLCVYFVMRVQFSSVVHRSHKPIVNTLTLLAGPIPLFVLTILSIAKQISTSQLGTFEAIKRKLQNLQSSVKLSGLISFRDKYTIKLIDSSGRSIKEIYGHGKRGRSSGILNLTEQVIWNALEESSSDILIDPKNDSTYSIRFRVDGVLWEVEQIDADTCRGVINSIKAVSNMNIDEKRRPQDGAFVTKTAKGVTSFRVASAGALYGEKISIRILRQDAGIFTMENVGLSKEHRSIIEDAIAKPTGMVLMCGPAGSGKTTTLYAMLSKIDLFTRNVITVEDPIEYVLTNASQIEVNPKAGITFATSLRSILRQDPDVVCVGEIRDEETAGIALRAAQTSLLVLTTIHSGTPASSLIRLMDLEVSPMLLSSGLSLIVSQRLLRRLCNYCKAPAKLTEKQIKQFEKEDIDYENIFQAVGCEYCRGTGYKGRIGIFDVLPLDDQLKAGIATNTLPVIQIRKEGEIRGKRKLQKEGLKKVSSGITSLEELNRVVG